MRRIYLCESRARVLSGKRPQCCEISFDTVAQAKHRDCDYLQLHIGSRTNAVLGNSNCFFHSYREPRLSRTHYLLWYEARFDCTKCSRCTHSNFNQLSNYAFLHAFSPHWLDSVTTYIPMGFLLFLSLSQNRKFQAFHRPRRSFMKGKADYSRYYSIFRILIGWKSM